MFLVTNTYCHILVITFKAFDGNDFRLYIKNLYVCCDWGHTWQLICKLELLVKQLFIIYFSSFLNSFWKIPSISFHTTYGLWTLFWHPNSGTLKFNTGPNSVVGRPWSSLFYWFFSSESCYSINYKPLQLNVLILHINIWVLYKYLNQLIVTKTR